MSQYGPVLSLDSLASSATLYRFRPKHCNTPSRPIRACGLGHPVTSGIGRHGPAISDTRRAGDGQIRQTDRGLQEQDFTVLDDKQPKKIVPFRAVDVEAVATSDPPVEIVLVVDAINASTRALAYERDAIKKFLLQNGGKLAQPVSLVIFSVAGTNFSNSSRDGSMPWRRHWTSTRLGCGTRLAIKTASMARQTALTFRSKP